MNTPASPAPGQGQDPAEQTKPLNPEPPHQQPKDPEKDHQPEPGQGHSEHPKQ